MEDLPFGDATFGAAIGVNAFQFAGDAQRALREAARVARPVAGSWPACSRRPGVPRARWCMRP